MTNLDHITPENAQEEQILADLKEAAEFSNSPISIITSELRDDPDSWDYTLDDFEVALYKWGFRN